MGGMPGYGAARRGQPSEAGCGCGGGGGGMPAASSWRMRAAWRETSARVVASAEAEYRAHVSTKEAGCESNPRARTARVDGVSVVIGHAAAAGQQPEHVAADGAAVDGRAVCDVVRRRKQLVAPPAGGAKLLENERLAQARALRQVADVPLLDEGEQAALVAAAVALPLVGPHCAERRQTAQQRR